MDQHEDAEREKEMERLLSIEKVFNRLSVSLQDNDGSEDDLQYIKIINFGQKCVTNDITGYLPLQILRFLTALHPKPRMVYLSRHGQSEYNLQKKIGGNSSLTPAGHKYATNLAHFAEQIICREGKEPAQAVKARLWTSSLKRTIETVSKIPHPVVDGTWVQMQHRVYRSLDEIYAGNRRACR